MSKILYIGPVRDFSGYATAARGYIQALHQAGADLVVRPVRYDQADPGTAYKVTDLERKLLKRDLNDVDVVIQHITPNEMRPVKGKVNVAISAWETTRIPPYWAAKLNQFDAVITFCDATVDAFKDSGVTVPVYKVPHTFDIPGYDLTDVEPAMAPSQPDYLSSRFVFYNISQFATKKGIDLLLRAYFGGFHGKKDDVILILKTYVNMAGRKEEDAKLRQYVTNVKQSMRLPPDEYPPLMVITKTLTEERIQKLHAAGDCYVCSSRGEGWCIPAFDALAYGKKLVTTTWGGMGEFAIAERAMHGISSDYDALRENVYPVDYSLEPLVGQTHPDPELYTSFDLVAEASVSSLIKQMREAYDDRDVRDPAPDLMEFDYSTVGPNMKDLIGRIVDDASDDASDEPPMDPVPVPASPAPAPVEAQEATNE